VKGLKTALIATILTIGLLAGSAFGVAAQTQELPRLSSVPETEANEAAYFDAFFAQDLDAVMATFTDDAVFEDQTLGDRLEGASAVRGMQQVVLGLTDAGATELLDRFVSSDGNRAVTVLQWTGTSAVGRPFDLPRVVVHEYRDGRIAKESLYYAAKDAFAQLTEPPSTE